MTTGHNDGRIQSQTSPTGEQVQYQYDSLGRLTSAATVDATWGLSFAYDGFGNRTAQTPTKGSAPSSSLAYDQTTNRIIGTGYTYSTAGNMTGFNGITMTYDGYNRPISNGNGNGTQYWIHSPNAERVVTLDVSGNNCTEKLTFYGPDGALMAGFVLGTCDPNLGGNYTFAPSTGAAEWREYFAGQWIQRRDIRGSVWEANATYRVFSYGENGVGSGDQFATYNRTGYTQVDYARNRAYVAGLGRFTSPDPLGTRANVSDPQSWNRYLYVAGDTVNRIDPGGRYWCYIGDCSPTPQDDGDGLELVYDELPQDGVAAVSAPDKHYDCKALDAYEHLSNPTDLKKIVAVLLGEATSFDLTKGVHNAYQAGDFLRKPTGPPITIDTLILESVLFSYVIINNGGRNSSDLDRIAKSITTGTYRGLTQGLNILSGIEKADPQQGSDLCTRFSIAWSSFHRVLDGYLLQDPDSFTLKLTHWAGYNQAVFLTHPMPGGDHYIYVGYTHFYY